MIERLFYLDMQQKEAGAASVWVSQGNENAVSFAFRLFDGSQELDCQRFSSAKALFAVNGKAVAACDCRVDADKITCLVPDGALGRHGLVTGQLTLAFPPDGQLTTNYFSFNVLPGLAQLSEGERRIYVNEIDELARELREAIEGAGQGSADLDGIMGGVKAKAAEINAMVEGVAQSGQTAKEIALEAGKTAQALTKLLNDSANDAKGLSAALDTAADKLKALDASMAQAQSGISGIAGYLEAAGNDAKAVQAVRTETQAIKADTQTIKTETQAIKAETQTIKTETQAIKADALTIKADTQAIADSAKVIKDGFAQTVKTAETDVAAQTAAVASARTANIGIMDRHIADVARKKEDAVQEMFGYVAGLEGETFVTQNEFLAAMAAVGDGGGQDNGFRPFQFDMSAFSNNWAMYPDCVNSVSNASVALVGDDIYAFGCGYGAAYSQNTYIFNTKDSKWRDGPMSPKPAYNSGTALWNGKAYVCGGTSNSLSIQILDVAKGTWSHSADCAASMKMIEVAAAAYKNKIYINGGDAFQENLRIYDIAANTWSQSSKAPMVMKQSSQNAVVCNDRLYIFGCSATNDETLIYNLQNDTWATGTCCPVQVNLRAAILTEPGEIVIHSAGNYRQTLVYYTATDKWGALHASPYASNRSRGAYHDNRLFYIGSATVPMSAVLVYERPPATVRLLDCKAGDVVWASCGLATESGQTLPRRTENVIAADGCIMYKTNEMAGIVTMWRRRG